MNSDKVLGQIFRFFGQKLLPFAVLVYFLIAISQGESVITPLTDGVLVTLSFVSCVQILLSVTEKKEG